MKLNINNITKIYSETALFDECSFEIILKQKVAIIGENGSGKSTLLKMITGIESYQEGDIFIPKKIKVGYLSQEFDMYENTAYSYIKRDFLKLTELKDRLNQAAYSLSESNHLALDLNKYARLQEEYESLGDIQLKMTSKELLLV